MGRSAVPGRLRRQRSGDVAAAIAGWLGDERTFDCALNLCQLEQPSLHELVSLVAELLGVEPQLVAMTPAQLAERGLHAEEISPFSTRWMSHLDPARALALGLRPTPLREYLGRIVASFLATPPDEPPAGYRHRAAELGAC